MVSSVALGGSRGRSASRAVLCSGKRANRTPPRNSKNATAPYSNSWPTMPGLGSPSPSLLILGEMGYFPLDRLAAQFLFQLVSRRYQKTSINLTSNKSYGDWGDVLADPVLASAILDRLLHFSTTVTIRGQSYRLPGGRCGLGTAVGESGVRGRERASDPPPAVGAGRARGPHTAGERRRRRCAVSVGGG